MKSSRPGMLGIRAINQYRRRDILPYLGLRYYLNNAAASQDGWARHVAIDLVVNRTNSPYFRASHFKELRSTGESTAAISHREILLPGANEGLVEAALLAECATRAEFANPPNVYSYALCEPTDGSGVFQHYMAGLRERHRAIAEACVAFPDGIVRYTDIRRFYPSVRTDNALAAWRETSRCANLPLDYRVLGEKLIDEHSRVQQTEGAGILTGPMFSHLLANLVLRRLDREVSYKLPAKYFRYVDDIVFVGNPRDVKHSVLLVQEYLSAAGFELHDDDSSKSIEVLASHWLTGRADFEKPKQPVSWMRFVSDLKRYLLLHPDRREDLQEAFRSEGLRIPTRDYASVIKEAGYVTRMRNLFSAPWFRLHSSPSMLIEQALWLRRVYTQRLNSLLEEVETARGFDRKRLIPQLRYRSARLIYLATDEALSRSPKVF